MGEAESAGGTGRKDGGVDGEHILRATEAMIEAKDDRFAMKAREPSHVKKHECNIRCLPVYVSAGKREERQSSAPNQPRPVQVAQPHPRHRHRY